MTANDAFWMLQSEGIFYVLAAQFDALLSLAAIKAYAFQRLVFNRNVSDVRHTFGNKQALIIATLAHSAFCEWHGDNQINAFKEAVVLHFACHHLAKLVTNGCAVMIFKVVNSATGRRFCRIIEPGGSLFNGHLLPENAAKWVVEWRKSMVSAWQMTVTWGTNHLFSDGQPTATDSTQAWCNEVEKPI